jgi:hypothetical protein
MTGLSEILALAIGLFFVYLLLSAITSYITEAISGCFRLRAENLREAIQQLLDPPSPENANQPNHVFLDNFYKHPIIKSLSAPNSRPSYISARDFSMTLLDLLVSSQPIRSLNADQYSEQYYDRYPERYLAAVKIGVNCLEGNLSRSLLPLIEYAEVIEPDPKKRVVQVRQNIDDWYTTTMDRASGWYKNRVQGISIIVGFLVVCALNADTINIARSLWENASMRQEAIQMAAAAFPKNGEGANQKDGTDTPEEILAKLSNVSFPLGWGPLKVKVDSKMVLAEEYEELKKPLVMFSKIMGLLITALAISVGSSIWFDILDRVINLRSTGIKPQNYT